MFCKKCGDSVSEEASFCRKCGEKKIDKMGLASTDPVLELTRNSEKEKVQPKEKKGKVKHYSKKKNIYKDTFIAIIIAISFIILIKITFKDDDFSGLTEDKDSSEPVQEEKNATSDWITYKNEKYNFSINYPEDWFVETKINEFTKEDFITFKNTEKPLSIEYDQTSSLAFFIQLYNKYDANTYREYLGRRHESEMNFDKREDIVLQDGSKIEMLMVTEENEDKELLWEIVEPAADAFYESQEYAYIFYIASIGTINQKKEIDIMRNSLKTFKVNKTEDSQTSINASESELLALTDPLLEKYNLLNEIINLSIPELEGIYQKTMSNVGYLRQLQSIKYDKNIESILSMVSDESKEISKIILEIKNEQDQVKQGIVKLNMAKETFNSAQIDLDFKNFIKDETSSVDEWIRIFDSKNPDNIMSVMRERHIKTNELVDTVKMFN